MIYRNGSPEDLNQIKQLAVKSWSRFENQLTEDNWHRLQESLTDDNTYRSLLEEGQCILCQVLNGGIIGMVFLIPSGKADDVYREEWARIRFLTVHPDYEGRSVGRVLAENCLRLAANNGEKLIALHTSEIMQNAMKLYEHLGFTINREIDQRLGKRYWLYTKTL